MTDETLNVRLGDIAHGWLPITFTVAGIDALVDASDVPTDPISQLVSFARFLLSPELGLRTAEFHLEPAYCVLTANKSDSHTVGIRLVQPGVNLVGSAFSCVATATQIWRALRGIESAVDSAIIDEQWSWDFPTTQMDMLASEIETASGLSQLNLRVDGVEFDACVVDFHLPIDATLDGINVFVPGGGFFAEFGFAANASARDALTGDAAEFVLCNVEPAAMLGGIVKFDTAHQ